MNGLNLTNDPSILMNNMLSSTSATSTNALTEASFSSTLQPLLMGLQSYRAATEVNGTTGYALTDAQKKTLQDILAFYDAAELTDKDMQHLKNELQQTGLLTVSDLKPALEAAGFKLPADFFKTTAGTVDPAKAQLLQIQISNLVENMKNKLLMKMFSSGNTSDSDYDDEYNDKYDNEYNNSTDATTDAINMASLMQTKTSGTN